MNDKKSNKFLFSLSMLIFGTIGLFVKNINISSGELALYRALMAIGFLIALFLVKKQRIDFKKIKKEMPLLFLSGAAMGINWILLFQAYKYTTVSVATLSYYFAPVIVTVVCPVIFHEKMKIKDWVCFIMSTVGIVLITGIGDLSKSAGNAKGVLFGLGAAFFYACVMLLNKFIKNVDGINRTFLQFIAATAVLLPYVIASGENNIKNLDTTGVICLLVVGLIHTGVTYCVYFSSLKELSGQKVAILSYIDPLVAVIMSVAVLNEKITFVQAVGGIMILGFTMLNEISFGKKQQ